MKTENLKIQKQQLKAALEYAEIIEDFDWHIENDPANANYFKTARVEAVENYADAVAAIIESSIDIAVEFETKKISDGLFETLNKINRDYAKQNGISLLDYTNDYRDK